MNGVNSHLLSHITGLSVLSHQEARESTFSLVYWARWKRVRWLGHILRGDDLSYVKETMFAGFERGEKGTLLDEAPPHRSRKHLEVLARKDDNFWKEWSVTLKGDVTPKNRNGLHDPGTQPIVVAPPNCLTSEVLEMRPWMTFLGMYWSKYVGDQ